MIGVASLVKDGLNAMQSCSLRRFQTDGGEFQSRRCVTGIVRDLCRLEPLMAFALVVQ